jgi:hypothetical protein
MSQTLIGHKAFPHRSFYNSPDSPFLDVEQLLYTGRCYTKLPQGFKTTQIYLLTIRRQKSKSRFGRAGLSWWLQGGPEFCLFHLLEAPHSLGWSPFLPLQRQQHSITQSLSACDPPASLLWEPRSRMIQNDLSAGSLPYKETMATGPRD